MIKMSEYAKRRKQLMQKIGPSSLVILTAAPIAPRNGDGTYPYRQQSDFYYLTGFEEPEAVAILAPKNKNGEFILFNRAKNRSEEIWEGFRSGQEGAVKHYGANLSFPITEFENKLAEYIEGREKIYYPLGNHSAFDQTLINTINNVRGKIRSGLRAPVAIIDIIDVIHEMRLIKSAAEIAVMRKAATISVEGHLRAMKACKPGMHEYQLEAELQYEFQKQGARFLAYTSIVGSGANSCILHYTHNNQKIADGSLVLIDAGCEYQNYAADITRTFPANGKFSAEQRAIYEIVLAAQLAAIKQIKPGASWSAAQEVIVKIITQGLLDIGIVKGKLKDLIAKQAYFPFYMHKSGHWLGLDVHDAGRYKVAGKWQKLQPGMVLTVEPGIYISADIPNVPKKWHNIGIRIEDDVLVTKTGHDVLTQRLPKTITDIEALMEKC